MYHPCMQTALGTGRGDDWLGGSFPFAAIIELQGWEPAGSTKQIAEVSCS